MFTKAFISKSDISEAIVNRGTGNWPTRKRLPKIYGTISGIIDVFGQLCPTKIAVYHHNIEHFQVVIHHWAATASFNSVFFHNFRKISIGINITGKLLV